MANRWNIRSILSLWFGFTTRVDRATYVRWGVALMTLKYLLDATVVWAVTAQWWSPARYLSPLWTVRMAQFPQAPGLLFLWLGLVTLPFFWIGVSMSVRRAADAGLEPFIGLGFAVPGLNSLVILLLALTRSSAKPTWSPIPTEPEGPVPGLRSALVAIAGAVVVGLVMGALAARGWGAYGLILFFITPLLMGVITGYALNRHHRRPAMETIGAAVIATVLTAGGLLLVALEGVVCLAMAAPIALTIVIIGALLGRAIAVYGRPATASILIALLALPSLGLAERRMEEPVLYEVVTAIDVAAPPAIVWQHVVGFSDLPTPTGWLFRTGIAYPVRARLNGTGVGAIRTCEFSTGAFVEPITAWEPGRRLAFDVRSQPAPMQEWSFYAAVHPPHLDTLLRSRRGEFRLSAGSNGGTHLEGHTWYELTAAPSPYWRLWSDLIIHRIHQQVLEHVARLSLNKEMAVLSQSGWTLTQAPPREVRRLYWELIPETEVWVRLTPETPQAKSPLVNLVFHAFYPGRAERNPYTGLPEWPKHPPSRLTVSAEPSGLTLSRELSLRLVIDGQTIDLTGPKSRYRNLPCLIATEDCTPNAVEAEIDASTLRSVTTARSVGGSALGFPIALVAADQLALKEFLTRIGPSMDGPQP